MNQVVPDFEPSPPSMGSCVQPLAIRTPLRNEGASVAAPRAPFVRPLSGLLFSVGAFKDGGTRLRMLSQHSRWQTAR